MAELEIHHEHEHSNDPAGKRVGIQAALLGVLLAVVTIFSHRTHTASIMHKSTANDQWAYYQATRIKLHNTELALNLIQIVGPKAEAAEGIRTDYEKQAKKYEEQSKANQDKAREADEAAERDEHIALRYDIGEGLLEIGLVLSSLYFISRKQMFPVMGIAAGILGTICAVLGVFQ
ncbi:MAG: DUF4337 domain-containing protein [Acidobacteriota bacterium]|nr:DUF4337 domain-containing protein [Acidobacteriota bacterium]